MNNSSQSPSSAPFGYIYGEQNWQDVVDQTDKKSYSNPQAPVGMVSLASISPPDSEFSMDTPNLNTSWNAQDSYSVDCSIRDTTEDGSPINDALGDLEDSHRLAQDKRKRRRESHNAVERRRREKINERIRVLGTLLPESCLDYHGKINKGIILKATVDYIRELQRDRVNTRWRIQQLEHELTVYRKAY
ncbi:helix-loop-helix DNA-binding domain-containing protein [Umbelopsis sp. PMI_123]|nr:helix-loop-helix DNA-binding domain-containing protein [Umbelopsis sp. PMI_123]